MSKLLQLSLFTIILSISLFSLYRSYSSNDLVFIDTNKLLNGYQGMIDARGDFQQKASLWKSNIDTLAAEVEKSIKDYEKESTKMTAKEKELSRELIRTKQKQLADYQRAMQDKAAQEDNQMTKLVLDQVNAYITKYGKEHGYPIVLATTETGNIAYADEGLDITDEVLKGLNKEYTGQ